MFTDVHMFPEPWMPAAPPAYEYLAKHPELLAPMAEETAETARRANLRKLLQNKNPLLVLMAFRQLIEAKAVDTTELKELLARLKGYQLAAVIYLTVRQAPGLLTTKLPSGAPISAIGALDNLEVLTSAALGAYAAATDATPNAAAPHSRSLRRPIRSPSVPIVTRNPAIMASAM